MISNQVVLVTGAAGRIGSAISRAIVFNNGKVILSDIDDVKGRVLSRELGEEAAVFIQADVTNSNNIDEIIDKACTHFGHLDAAVHSAYPRSSAWGTPFESLKSESLVEDLRLQLGGAILFSQKIIQHFMKQGNGNLIHISSIQGIAAPKFDHYIGTEMNSPIEYSAIKSGIIAITRWLAKYYANQNIRVNCISPGGILSEQPDIFLEKYRASCTSKGMLDAEDIVGAVIFLLSDASNYINGQNIIVDDGWML